MAGSSWNSTMFWVRRFCPSAPVKKPARKPLLGQEVADRPVGQGEHPPPLAEDDHLPPLLEHELADELAESPGAWARRAP